MSPIRLPLLMLIALAILDGDSRCVSAADGSEKTAGVPVINEIAGFRPPLARRPAGFLRSKPTVVETDESLVQAFGPKGAERIRKQVDFSKQFLVCFRWAGSGQDRLSLRVDEKDKKPKVIFTFQPGRTRDLRPHAHLYVIRSGVAWEIGNRTKTVDRAGQNKDNRMKAEAEAFLQKYQREVAKLELRANLAWWAAANSGKKEAFGEYAAAHLALRKYHSDPETYSKIQRLMKIQDRLEPLDARSLEVAELAFKGNQLPVEMLKEMVERSTRIEQIFKTFRGELDGKRLSNNDLLEMLGDENDSARRKAIWETLKQPGDAVGAKLVELARLRNRAAEKLGYANYWEMQIKLQEHDPKLLVEIFAELERLTDGPFQRMKARLDGELARRFNVEPGQMMPWHYDNPFFQAAPPSARVDLDEFYEKGTKEDIVRLAGKFFTDIGLPIEAIVARSDLYEREGKDQHAFSISIDRADDVRTLLNIKPTAEWMDTMLHEQGHAVYDVGIDRSLPYNLREPAHAFTTEGVAMLFGALGKNPTWMIGYAGADPKRVGELEEAIYEQRTREQLIFARWTLVMLNFEKALYEDPERDLNQLWWDLKERFQGLHRPPRRNQPASLPRAHWAAKPHFTIAPVYYHNYMLGELFAAQVRHVLAEMVDHTGPTANLSFNGRKEFGTLLKNKVFKPGNSKPWPEFVRDVTGEEFTPKYFAAEVR